MVEKSKTEFKDQKTFTLLNAHDCGYNSYNAKIVRVIACLAVVITHLGAYLTKNELLKTYFDFGAEGVRAFFILSGFFMCCSKELRNGEITKYYKKRLIRIVPVYYLVITIYAIWGITGFYPWPKDDTGLYWIRYYFFVSTSVPSKEEYWRNLGATWTISYFLLFYILSPLFLAKLNSWKKCIFSVLPLLIIGAIIPDGVVEPLKGLSVFVLGMAIFYAIQENKVIETALLYVIMGLLFYIPGFSYPYGDGFIIGAIILFMLASGNEYRIRFLDKGVDWVNKHSYTIYLLHVLVIIGLSNVVASMGVSVNRFLFVGAVIAFSFWGTLIVDASIAKIIDYIGRLLFAQNNSMK